MVISLVERQQFWLKLVYDIKNADERAESGMLGVIQGADIGNHEVIEKKVIENSIKRIVQIANVTDQLPPSKKSEKNRPQFFGEFSEQILLKFSDFSESDFVISV